MPFSLFPMPMMPSAIWSWIWPTHRSPAPQPTFQSHSKHSNPQDGSCAYVPGAFEWPLQTCFRLHATKNDFDARTLVGESQQVMDQKPFAAALLRCKHASQPMRGA